VPRASHRDERLPDARSEAAFQSFEQRKNQGRFRAGNSALAREFGEMFEEVLKIKDFPPNMRKILSICSV
jgi:hypothetical protein